MRNKISYIKITIAILIAIVLINCSNTNKLANYELNNCYKGKQFNLDVFVKTNDTIAIMNWYYEEKIPRSSFSDTLQIFNIKDTVWKSSVSKIYVRKNKLILYTTHSPYEPNIEMRVKLKPYKIKNWEEEYSKINNLYKNKK